MINAIETRSVSKVYRTAMETSVGLHDLSMEIGANQFAALVGPNGAGKTSAIKLIATLARPTTGRVTVFGHDVVREGQAVRRLIGYAGQETSTDLYATPLENIRHHATMYGLTASEARASAAELLDTFGLHQQAGMEVRRLSGGQRRRLDIALSMVHRPRLLILDEPTVNLDPDGRRRLWDILCRLRAERDLTILFSTHYLDEADGYADKVIFVDKGRCVAAGTVDQLKASLGGECLVLQFDDGDHAMRAARRLTPTEQFKDAMVAGERIVTACSTTEHITAILNFLAERDLAPKSVTLSRPSLDDVYIRLTGASFEQVNIDAQNSRHQRLAWSWL